MNDNDDVSAANDAPRGNGLTAEEQSLIAGIRESHGKCFAVNYLGFLRRVFNRVWWQSGHSIHEFGYSRDGLRVLDERWLEPELRSIEEYFAESESGCSSSDLWGVYCMLGVYLGDVIVEDLGGEWRNPSTLRIELSRSLSWPELLFFHWNVKLNGKRIPVFKIAKWRFDGSERVPSLAEAYDRIKSTGTWP